MSYEDLAEKFKEGAKIRRREWDNWEFIFLGVDGYGSPAICNSVGYVKELTTLDILAEDWEEVDD